jgi:hypothetical protein
MAARRESEKRERLLNSCPPSKVRTYACNEDGFRVVKYFNYEYDFKQGQCVESVKEQRSRCDDGDSDAVYRGKGRYAGE